MRPSTTALAVLADCFVFLALGGAILVVSGCKPAGKAGTTTAKQGPSLSQGDNREQTDGDQRTSSGDVATARSGKKTNDRTESPVNGGNQPSSRDDADRGPSGAEATAPAKRETPDKHETGTSDDRPLLPTDWKNPRLYLLVTGRQDGYLEPCGCTGLANQKGGLMRRQTFRDQLAATGVPVVPVDVGNQVRRFGRQSEIKFQTTSAALKAMKYEAVGFGADDLRLSINELVSATTPQGDPDARFVCANMTLLDDAEFTPPFRIVKAGGRTIGITAVLGSEGQQEIQSDEIKERPAEEALREVLPKLEAAQCDLLVLLAHVSTEETRELARKFPQFDLIVTAAGGGIPTYEPETIEDSKAKIIQVGSKAMYAGVLGLFDDGEPIRYARVELDARLVDSPEMQQLFAAYQDQLQNAGLDGLGVKPVPHPSGHNFVGALACAECHEAEHQIWKDGHPPDTVGPHLGATEAIVHPKERATVARHFDPECLSCHVTGWNPQKYFPYSSGYLDLKASEHLLGNGCENCHGPGSGHVEAEKGSGGELQSKLRAEMRLPLERAKERCMECHDLDNDPNFLHEGAFEKYWERIKH